MLERKMILKIALTLVLAFGLCWSALADKEDLRQTAGTTNPNLMSEMVSAEGCGHPIDAREAPSEQGAGAPPRGNLRFEFLHEEFEVAVPPAGWSAIITNPNFTWKKAGMPFHVGTSSATVLYDPDMVPQDEWLKTPVMDLSTAVEALHVEFWWMMSYHWGVSPHDNYDMELWISTDGGATFPTMLWTETDEPEFTNASYNWHWFRAVVDLSAYRVANVVLAWRYVGVDGAQGCIDLVSVNDNEGRCCYGIPSTPTCEDGISEHSCGGLGGSWAEGLNCTDHPCPVDHIPPSDDMYTDPDTDKAIPHVHPVAIDQLWTADVDLPCGSHHQRTMIKFDLSAYMGMQVDSAFLNIFRFLRCPMDFFTTTDFYHITEDWDEDTWDDMVHIDHGASAWNTFIFGPDNDWYRVDIKTAVEDWLGGSVTNYGFVIQARTGEKCTKFFSKEGPAGLRPYLELYVATGCCNHDGIRGDADGSGGAPNVGDVAYLVSYLFDQPPGPAPPCFEEGDVEASGSINVGDLAWLVSYLFDQPPGPAPLPCP